MLQSSLAVGAQVACVVTAAADTYLIRLDPSVVAADEVIDGRLILFFITATGPRWADRAPIEGPFWEMPQPIGSVEVHGVRADESITVDGSSAAFPGPLDELEGHVRVQAILDRDTTERSHLEGPGNLYCTPERLKLAASLDETVILALDHRVNAAALPADTPTLRWLELRSALLSEFYARDVFHRAGVALPPRRGGPERDARGLPAVYVIPGFGGRHEGARHYARLLDSPGGANMPQAAYVVLDPESPLSHHGFVDSPNNGPRGTALVTELIPFLEERLGLVARPEARIVTGHSSGGWAALWLQLAYPEVFGGCWSSAPDPVDFSAFQMCDLYADERLYFDSSGRAVPSFRHAGAGDPVGVRMTVRQECLMEYFIHPLGGSGGQWDTWEAMFSPRDPATGFPRPMFDPLSGRIDRDVVAHWSRFDVARVVAGDWPRYGPIVTGRIRLACGTVDDFYLERAVRRFERVVAGLAGGEWSPGYVWLVEGATHGTVERFTKGRWSREMIQHFRRHGLHD
jgi:hypothetical protein